MTVRASATAVRHPLAARVDAPQGPARPRRTGPSPRPTAETADPASARRGVHGVPRDPHDLPDAGGVAATVVVTLDLDTLLGGLKAAGLCDGSKIPPAKPRLACGAGIIPVVLGGKSQPPTSAAHAASTPRPNGSRSVSGTAAAPRGLRPTTRDATPTTNTPGPATAPPTSPRDGSCAPTPHPRPRPRYQLKAGPQRQVSLRSTDIGPGRAGGARRRRCCVKDGGMRLPRRRVGCRSAAGVGRLGRPTAAAGNRPDGGVGLRRDGWSMHGYCSLVVPALTEVDEAVVLKAFDGDDESEHEALGACGTGDGRVRSGSLRADPPRRALLLERLHPTDLSVSGTSRRARSSPGCCRAPAPAGAAAAATADVVRRALAGPA